MKTTMSCSCPIINASTRLEEIMAEVTAFLRGLLGSVADYITSKSYLVVA